MTLTLCLSLIRYLNSLMFFFSYNLKIIALRQTDPRVNFPNTVNKCLHLHVHLIDLQTY